MVRTESGRVPFLSGSTSSFCSTSTFPHSGQMLSWQSGNSFLQTGQNIRYDETGCELKNVLRVRPFRKGSFRTDREKLTLYHLLECFVCPHFYFDVWYLFLLIFIILGIMFPDPELLDVLWQDYTIDRPLGSTKAFHYCKLKIGDLIFHGHQIRLTKFDKMRNDPNEGRYIIKLYQQACNELHHEGKLPEEQYHCLFNLDFELDKYYLSYIPDILKDNYLSSRGPIECVPYIFCLSNCDEKDNE